MNSPLTGNLMKLHCVKDSTSYRRVKCKYNRWYWECPDTKEQFTTTEMDEDHLNQIKWYWQSTRSPRQKENKVEKLLRDLLNKYKSWYQQQTQCKLGRTPNFKYETELLAKIEVLNEIKNKLR